MTKKSNIIFVYNADSSVFAQLSDYVHKIVSPETYECNLCKITYGNLGIKKRWRKFIQNLPHKVSFLHKDELASKYPDLANTQLPAVFKEEDQKLRLIISAEEMNKPSTIDELMELVKKKIKAPTGT